MSDGAGQCFQMGQVGVLVSIYVGQCVRWGRSVCQVGQVSVSDWTGQYVRWDRSVCCIGQVSMSDGAGQCVR